MFRNRNLTPGQHVGAVSIFAEPFDRPTAVKHAANPLVHPYNVQQTGKASRGFRQRGPPAEASQNVKPPGEQE